MIESLPIDLVSRWTHVATAIVILGGSVFLRFVLIPAASGLPDAEHEAFRGRLMGTWRKVVSVGIALFLLSGLYNYVAVALPRHRGDGLYHGLMGLKMLLAFVVFFLASALAGRSKAFEGMRRDNRRWLVITVALGFVIVGISGYLRVARPGTVPSAVEASAEPEG
ncbi:hypothetical protein [Tautonia plasticadhaerens]|uniref:Copper resistance protein D n=1 Tax=Tautonia plasticadhaerens TaxID=2527974 RepID=A0A518GWT2_9BACT|nr:hypothetical protein [Tautonia plasticadhaerens]QDV33049.1 hypothetical protein ElP_08910 [Tautonia plasticadhaerens]